MVFKKLTPEQLRCHKGSSFTGITTVFFCHDGNGHLLLGKRSLKARDEHGAWDPGAGGLKHVLVDPSHVKLNEPDTLDQIGWFSLDNLPTPMHSQYKLFDKKYGAKLKAILTPAKP